jgi:hypothetical protein
MQYELSDVSAFKSIIQPVTRFSQRAHVEASSKGVRLRSIDPHDFCYVDLHFLPAFFESSDGNGSVEYGLDVSKLGSILQSIPSTSPLQLNFKESQLRLKMKDGGKTFFAVNSLKLDPFDLPEPLKFEYDCSVTISSVQFLNNIKRASAISSEICFTIGDGKFSMSASSGDFSFYTEPEQAIINQKGKSVVSSYVVVGYLRSLTDIISKCENVTIDLNESKPTKLDLHYNKFGKFSFFLSNRKAAENSPTKDKQDRQGLSLPRISITKFPDFLLRITKDPDGVDTETLRLAHVDTAGGDYSRLGHMLGLIETKNKKVLPSPSGEELLRQFQVDQDKGKLELHRIAVQKLPHYKSIMKHLLVHPMPTEEIYDAVNKDLKEMKLPTIAKPDLMTLLAVATWCGSVDRKFSLYYFAKANE